MLFGQLIHEFRTGLGTEFRGGLCVDYPKACSKDEEQTEG